MLTLTTITILVVLFLFPQIWQRKPSEETVSPEQAEINQQLKELDELRQQNGQQAATDEEIEQQLEQLDVLKEQSQQKPPTAEEIKKQLDELDALRAKSTQ